MSCLSRTAALGIFSLLAAAAAAQQCPPGTTEVRVEDSPTEIRVFCQRVAAPANVLDAGPTEFPIANPTIALLREQEHAPAPLRFDIEHPEPARIVEPDAAVAREDEIDRLAKEALEPDSWLLSGDAQEFAREVKLLIPTAEVAELAGTLGGALRAVLLVDAVEEYKKGNRVEAAGKAAPIVAGVIYMPAGIVLGAGAYLGKNAAIGYLNYKNLRAGKKPDVALETAVREVNEICAAARYAYRRFVCAMMGKAQ